jgi:hypothetical protein
MSNVWGVVEDGYCVNIIVADVDWTHNAEGRYILSTHDNIAWIGAKVTKGKFEKQELPPSPDKETVQ